MKRISTKILSIAFLSLLAAVLLSVTAFAATAGSGYAVDMSGKETNIKWTMDAAGVLTFEIDPNAKDKVQTTIIYNKDPKTGESADWSHSLPTFAEATKIIIGDGITEASGFAAIYSLGAVEIPKSLTVLGSSAFQCSTISSLYIRGNESVYGYFDLSNIETIGSYCFDGCYKLSMIGLNKNMTGEIPTEAFKGTALGEITIPEGITKLANRSFAQTGALKNIYFLGTDTEIASDNVFADNSTYPTINAKTGSKALEFAMANGYTYVNTDTGVKTEGEKPTTGVFTEGSGYAVDMSGKETNIKWTLDDDGVLTFEIDPSATDKVQSTVIYNKDPRTGDSADWSKALPTFSGATKIIIGDGITEISGFAAIYTLGAVEIPKSLKILGASAFQCSTVSSLYIRGNENVYGYFDLSNIEAIGSYCFDGCYKLSMVGLNKNMTGVIPAEAFKGTALGEITIPEGITKIANRSFAQTGALDNLYFLGTDTVIESDDVFAGNFTYPTIKAKPGSKALEFAMANGYTYVNTDTGVKTEGEKPTTGISQGDIVPDDLPEFEPEGATLYGHMTGLYLSNYIINTFWAYYDDTKTLELTSATTSYNETGTIWNCDPGTETWQLYKEKIEHIIIGDNISKITSGAFDGYVSLKDVKLGKNVGQIDAGAFANCSSLTTIWRDGSERVEGRFDLSGISSFGDIISNTAPRELYLNKKVTDIAFGLPMSLKTIYVYETTEALIKYAEDNFYNLQSLTDPSVFYENYVEIDLSMTACGDRCVFDFDEATGTLTVYGVGPIKDTINYYGGGSKTAPWFSIKQQVKHVVISEHITAIGKYAFCEFKNLETVQIPNSESFEILNAAFEECSNLKSIYRAGTEPIEGTLDLRNVHTLQSWSFAYDYLIANVIISPMAEKIGSSVFEGNITTNLANIYGTPGSYAEEYAKENGFTFYDIASSTPAAIKCTPPESEGETESESAEAETTEPETTAVSEPERPKVIFVDYEGELPGESGFGVLPIIIIAAVLLAALLFIILLKKKRGTK